MYYIRLTNIRTDGIQSRGRFAPKKGVRKDVQIHIHEDIHIPNFESQRQNLIEQMDRCKGGQSDFKEKLHKKFRRTKRRKFNFRQTIVIICLCYSLNKLCTFVYIEIDPFLLNLCQYFWLVHTYIHKHCNSPLYQNTICRYFVWFSWLTDILGNFISKSRILYLSILSTYMYVLH